MSNWFVMLVIGILSVILGVLALANPFEASITATLLAAWSFIILGVLQIIASFRAPSAGGKIIGVLLGLLAFVIGTNIVAEPLQGLLTLTVAAGVMFLVSGAFKAWFGFANTQGAPRIAMLLSAAVSLILGMMVLNNFPQSAAVLLGVLLAVELLSSGISFIALALMSKDIEEA